MDTKSLVLYLRIAMLFTNLYFQHYFSLPLIHFITKLNWTIYFLLGTSCPDSKPYIESVPPSLKLFLTWILLFSISLNSNSRTSANTSSLSLFPHQFEVKFSIPRSPTAFYAISFGNINTFCFVFTEHVCVHVCLTNNNFHMHIFSTNF